MTIAEIEQQKLMAEVQKIRAEIVVMSAQVEKMRNESKKIVIESFLYPLVVLSSIVGAVAAAFKFFN